MPEQKEAACSKKTDYRKLDASLLSAIHQAALDETYYVNVRIDLPEPLTNRRANYLKSLGIVSMPKLGTEGTRFIHGDLSVGDINKLTHRPWVKFLTLSRTLNLLAPRP